MRHSETGGRAGGTTHGLFGRFRIYMNAGIGIFLSIEFAIVVKLTILHAVQTHRFENLRLPVEYLCPLAIAFGFIAQINRIEHKNMLDADAANSFRDWIAVLVLFMYASLLDFGHLFCPR